MSRVFRLLEDGKCECYEFGSSQYNTKVWKDASLLAKDDNNECYSYYLQEPNSEGTYQPDLEKIAAAEYEYKTEQAENAVLKMIQDRVDTYNKAQSPPLTHHSVYTCNADMYVNNPDYDHQQFCIDVGRWNTKVWMEVRRLQPLIISGEIPEPTLEEFLAMLPPYEGVV